MKLYLDDVRNVPEGYRLVRSVFELIGMFKYYEEIITEISLDHDLGCGQLTGYDFCKWFEREYFNKTVPNITFKIHSQNPVGRKNMEQVLKHMRVL